MPVHTVVALRSEPVGVDPRVSLILDLSQGRLPAVLHWGADLGRLEPTDVEALLTGSIPPLAHNLVDPPRRLALLPEPWTGWAGRPGLSGSRLGQDWSPRFRVDAARLGGRDLATEARRHDNPPTLVSAGPDLLEIDAVAHVARLALTLRIALTPEGLVTVEAALTNLAPQPYGLAELVLALPVPSSAREVLDFGGRWAKERTPQRSELVTGLHLREGRHGRTGADAATLLHLGTPGFGFDQGEVWALHTAWSGNHLHYAERVSTGEQLIGGGELLLPGEVTLGEGQTYATPRLYASYGTGLDQVSRRFHRHLRARPAHPGRNRPITLNSWEAVYFDHDLDRLLALVERAAALGVERFVLDDGWFGGRRDDRAGLGDWFVSPDAWPDGLHPLVDRVTASGMQFGLWVEPEMVNLDSELARAHPDWILATGDRWPVESRHQQVLNLGVPGCYDHIRDALLALLADYDIGYLKWDHNRDLVDAGTAPSGRPGVHTQTLATYRLMDALRAAHPGLEIESCSSGGGRVDLGVLARTDRVWVSDCNDPLERQQMNRWTATLLPPELMGTHVASARSHTTGRVHDLSFRAGTAVFSHFGIEWDLTRASQDDLLELRDWVGFYREHRELLLGGEEYRLDVGDPSVVAHGVVAPDRRQALYSYACVSRSDVVSPGRLRFPGLDPARRYRVAPVPVGRPPRGLDAPAWWGVGLVVEEDSDRGVGRAVAWSQTTAVRRGVVTTGAALARSGLMAPQLDPEQVVLFSATAEGD